MVQEARRWLSYVDFTTMVPQKNDFHVDLLFER
jgi:hypothetical protein